MSLMAHFDTSELKEIIIDNGNSYEESLNNNGKPTKPNLDKEIEVKDAKVALDIIESFFRLIRVRGYLGSNFTDEDMEELELINKDIRNMDSYISSKYEENKAIVKMCRPSDAISLNLESPYKKPSAEGGEINKLQKENQVLREKLKKLENTHSKWIYNVGSIIHTIANNYKYVDRNDMLNNQEIIEELGKRIKDLTRGKVYNEPDYKPKDRNISDLIFNTTGQRVNVHDDPMFLSQLAEAFFIPDWSWRIVHGVSGANSEIKQAQ